MNYNEVAQEVEIKEVVWNEKAMEVTFYYEDKEALHIWKRDHQGERKTPIFLKEITYDLTNPNQAFNILIKVRNWIKEGKNLYKDYRTWNSWFTELVGKELPINEYGYFV